MGFKIQACSQPKQEQAQPKILTSGWMQVHSWPQRTYVIRESVSNYKVAHIGQALFYAWEKFLLG